MKGPSGLLRFVATPKPANVGSNDPTGVDQKVDSQQDVEREVTASVTILHTQDTVDPESDERHESNDVERVQSLDARHSHVQRSRVGIDAVAEDALDAPSVTEAAAGAHREAQSVAGKLRLVEQPGVPDGEPHGRLVFVGKRRRGRLHEERQTTQEANDHAHSRGSSTVGPDRARLR